MTKVTHYFYISTGAKSVFYTLRARRNAYNDNYICTLSTDADKAIAKATDYVEQYRARVGETEDFKIVFDSNADIELFKRQGKLSAKDTVLFGMIEDGLFPFGKHAHTNIADAPDSYILFWADKAKEENNPIVSALADACVGVALERGLFEKREEAKAAKFELDSKSNFVGDLGERMVFEGELFGCFAKEGWDGSIFYINKVRCGDDIITYMGKKLGEQGDVIKFRATVKDHNEWQGIKSTKVNRPKIL